MHINMPAKFAYPSSHKEIVVLKVRWNFISLVKKLGFRVLLRSHYSNLVINQSSFLFFLSEVLNIHSKYITGNHKSYHTLNDKYLHDHGDDKILC